MFIDEIKIKFIAGKGWDGLVSWRREKCIPKGGPFWWNGGKWWDVYLQSKSNLNTLSDFRHKTFLQAEDGEKWQTNLSGWAWGEDLIVYVPTGTLVKDAISWEIIVDLCENNMRFLLCRWGRGGFWNAHFATSTRQAPSFAEIWDIWEEREVVLELKLVADIGIIGIPSAGKSTLIWALTNVKPKIGDYPFTTLIPNLWVLEYKSKSLVLEDVPGLIEGASSGKWLGIQFLKHIERTKVLLHMLDLYRLDQVMSDYEILRNELKNFSESLFEKEEIIVLSKADLLDSEMKEFIKSEFLAKFGKKEIFIISSATGEGLEELKDYLISHFTTGVHDMWEEIHLLNADEWVKVINLKYDDDPKYVEVSYIGNYTFVASGKRLEQIVRMTNFDNIEAVMRVYDVLDKVWVVKKMEAKLKSILQEEQKDNSFFFVGSEEEAFMPKVLVSGKEIPLEKLKFNL